MKAYSVRAVGCQGAPRRLISRDATCTYESRDVRHRSIDTLGLTVLLHFIFLQRLDRAGHNLLLIPVETFKGNRDPSRGIKDVKLDAVAVHERLDEIDAELEILAKRIIALHGPYPPQRFID